MSREALREPIDRLFINRNLMLRLNCCCHKPRACKIKSPDVDAPQHGVDAHTGLSSSRATLKSECDCGSRRAENHSRHLIDRKSKHIVLVHLHNQQHKNCTSASLCRSAPWTARRRRP